VEETLDASSARVPVDLDLRGAKIFQVRVAKPNGRPDCGWMAFVGARFE
jgi:hypothetical protein